MLILTTIVCGARAQSATGNTTSESVGSSAADGTENVTVSTQKTKPEQNWLIATSGDVLDGSTAITFEVVKPSSLSQWPDMLRLSVLHDDKTDEISLTADQQKASDDAVRRCYFGILPKNISGLVRAFWRTVFANKRTLIFAPKVYGYLNKEGNTDIQRYRGYADWVFRYGREDGLILATQLRLGTSGRGSAQFDFTYPLRCSREPVDLCICSYSPGTVKRCSITTSTMAHK